MLGLALVLLPFLDRQAPIPLLLFALPVGLCAVRFGARGGLAAATVGVLIGVVWYLHDDQLFVHNGVLQLLLRAVVFVLLGGILGSVVDERRKFELTYHGQMEEAVRERTVELEDARLETLRMLALAAEYRDDATFPHTERVGRTSFLLALALGLPAAEAELIGLAAPLHDVGKLGVPDRILLKPGRLTAAEFERVKRHTSDGARILGNSNSEILKLAEQIALSHHEWWDGSGYPARLQGEQISLAGRIVALADVFDALTHDRPYKRAWPLDASTAEIQQLRGRQFDPDVVDAFDQLDPAELAEPTTRLGTETPPALAA